MKCRRNILFPSNRLKCSSACMIFDKWHLSLLLTLRWRWLEYIWIGFLSPIYPNIVVFQARCILRNFLGKRRKFICWARQTWTKIAFFVSQSNNLIKPYLRKLLRAGFELNDIKSRSGLLYQVWPNPFKGHVFCVVSRSFSSQPSVEGACSWSYNLISSLLYPFTFATPIDAAYAHSTRVAINLHATSSVLIASSGIEATTK